MALFSYPEAAPLGLAYHNYIDYRVYGAEFASVPLDPSSRGPSKRNEDSRIGPRPGYFAVDLHSLKRGPYKYFERFKPITKAGYSIFIYRITPEQADQARREMGLPPLAASPAP